MTEENNARTLQDIINDLQNNAMFRLSLSSKELFHSNFLAWVFDTYKEACKDFFKNINDEKFKIEHLNEILNSKTIKINREVNLGSIGPIIKNENENGKEKKKKCIADITIEYKYKDNNEEKNGLIVIENKFKSLPDKQQIKNYATAIAEYNKEANNFNEEQKKKRNNGKKEKEDKIIYNNVTIILLSYFEPDFDLQESNYNIKYYTWSYNDIKLFLKALNISKNNKDANNKIVENYIECLNLLNQFRDEICKETTYENGNSKLLQELNTKENKSFKDLITKIKANHFELWLRKNFNAEESFNDLHKYEPTFRSYFHNSACVDFSVKKGGYTFQIALQGNKYRREFIFNESNNNEKEAIKTYFEIKNSEFKVGYKEQDKTCKIDFKKKYWQDEKIPWIKLDDNEIECCSMAQNICNFKIDGGNYDKYRWFNIDKFFKKYGKKNLSYDNIWNKIKEDIEKLMKIILNN